MKLVLMGCLALQVFAVGTQTTLDNLLTCVRRPSWLLRIVFAMYIAVPGLAVLLAKLFHAPFLVEGSLLVFSIAAVAPLLPGKLFKLGVNAAFAQSLAAITTLLAIPLVPAALVALDAIFTREAAISSTAVASSTGTSFAVPLLLGIVVKAMIGPSAARLAEWAALLGSVVLVAVVLLVVIAQRTAVFGAVADAWLVIALFAVGSLLIGHVLGGPDPRERTALAIATVTRHPGLALLIVTTNNPQAHAVPAVLAITLGCSIATIPYAAWRKRSLTAHAGEDVIAPSRGPVS